MHLNNKVTDAAVYLYSQDVIFYRHLHHAFLAIFPDNNFHRHLHRAMHAIFPDVHDDYIKSNKSVSFHKTESYTL